MLGMMPANKKISSIILSQAGKPDEKLPDVQSDDSVGLEAAADKILKAFEDKDKKTLVEGLKDFFAMVELQEETEEEGLE